MPDSPNQMPKFILKHYFWQTAQKKAFFIGDSERKDIRGAKSIGLGTMRIKDYLREKRET